MNWKSTLALVLFVAAAGAWLWKGDEWLAKYGYTPRPPAASPSAEVVAERLTADAITRVELPTTDPSDPFVLERAPGTDAGWKLPGNWPLRQPEVAELVQTLAHLGSRFQPVPLAADTDMSRFGMAPSQRPLVARVTAGGQTYQLTFGDPPAEPGDAPFARPAYLRVNDSPEVLRLGPDVLPVLRRPADSYRKRQLFPDAERLKVAAGGGGFGPSPGVITPIVGDKVAAVEVRGPGSEVTVFGAKVPVPSGTFTLRHTEKLPTPVAAEKGADPALTPDQIARTWELSEPVRDRVDPDKLKALLTAVPDLWADDFVPPAPPPALAVGGAALAGALDDGKWLLKRAGLEKAERSLTLVRRAGGDKVTLQIGDIAKATERTEPPPPPQPGQPPFPPPMGRTVREEYRFAKLDNHPLVFVVKADKFADLFAKLGELKDPKLARFETGDVQELTVAVKGKPPVKLTRRKGNPKADKPEDREDRWYLDRQPNPVLAESAKVTELLDQIGRLEARGPAAVAKADPKGYDIADDGTTVTVVVQDKRADGQPPAPKRTYTLKVGTPDADGKKLPVQVAGWDRVNLVDDGVFKLIDRDAVAYRGRRLFDTAELKLDGLAVAPAGGEAFALTRDPAAADPKWTLTKPLASPTDGPKAQQLADDLSRLEVAEFVSEAPSADDLKKYGLDTPKRTVTLTFTGPGGKAHKLEFGGDREGKSEVYGRLDGGSVFAVAKSVVESLDKGAVALLPLQLWNVPTEKVTAVEVKRTEGGKPEAYKLTPDGLDWKLTGPFDAPVPYQAAQPTLAALANVKAEKYESLSAADAAKYGFDKPAVTATVTYKEKPPGAAADAPEATVTKTLVVGKSTGDGAGTRFAKLEGGATQPVFVVGDALVAGADKPALDLLDKTVLFLDPARVTKVQIAGPKPEDAVTLTKDDKGVWKADGVGFTVDAPTALRLAEAAARPPVVKFAGYGPAVNWAEFGLDKPEHTVTATLGGEKPVTHTIKLGKPSPDGGRFARVDDGPAVAVLPARATADLARTKLEFVDRTLLTFDPTQLNGLVRTKNGGELEIVPGTAVGWDIVKPAKQKADQQAVEELAEQLSRLRAERVASFGPKDTLGKFGLDKPAAAVTLKVGDKPDEKVLKIGNPVDASKPEGERFATVDGAAPEVAVGVLPAAISKKLLADPIAFRDRTLAKFVDADRLTLDRGDRKVTFAKVDGTWKVTEPVKADAEQADLDELVNALARLRADELVADKPADLKPFGLDKPEAKWVASDKGKDVLALLVGKTDGGRAFVKAEKGDVVGRLAGPLTDRVLGEYRKRKVFDGADAAQIDSLVISAGNGTFALRKEGPGWLDAAKPGDAVSTAAVNEVLDALAGLKAERYVSDQNADLKLYGLEKPERVVVFTQQGGVTKTLQIGREVGGTGGKQVYARVADPARTDVFVLSAADTAKLSKDRPAFAEPKK